MTLDSKLINAATRGKQDSNYFSSMNTPPIRWSYQQPTSLYNRNSVPPNVAQHIRQDRNPKYRRA